MQVPAGSWRAINLLDKVDQIVQVAISFKDWIFRFGKLLSVFEFGKAAMTLYTIWQERNSQLWNVQCKPISITILLALDFLFSLV